MLDESLRARLNWTLLDSAATHAGEIIRLFRRAAPPNPENRLEEAIAWAEILMAPENPAEAFRRAEAWLRSAGCETEAGKIAALLDPRARRRLSPLDLKAWSPARRRAARWFGAMEASGAETSANPAAIFTALMEGPPAGPGMLLASAVETLRAGNSALATRLIEENLRLYGSHQAAWASVAPLAEHGLGVSPALAEIGLALCRDRYEFARIVRYDALEQAAQYAVRLAAMGYPVPWERMKQRLDLLERQQPDALRTLMARAAHLSAEGRERAERDRLLRRAAGISDNETLDRTLREALRHGPGRPDM
ncbi:MAG: hypothetical protein BWZ10_03437 [candidate division BRC1 bacterium ADurb.BinA364]|nr:MAG: hypothetical protein BWZ10_03437 [candidate division BRC1 bacterium ADurb.BinA364]